LTAAAEAIESVDRVKAIRILADAALSSFGAGHPLTRWLPREGRSSC